MIQKAKYYDKSELEPQTRGRCREILLHFGATTDSLNGKNQKCIFSDCPGGGGKDRFRAIDPDNGVLFCNQCFYEKNGDIFAAVQRLQNCTFSEAVNKIGEYLNCPHSQPVKRQNPAPKKTAPPVLEQVHILEHDRAKLEVWASHKQSVTADALEAAGVVHCCWPKNSPQQMECVGFPTGDSSNPSGMILYRVDGQDFPAMEKGPKQRKTHILRGSVDGWIMFGGWSAVESAHTIIRCEGAADAAAIYSRLPDGYVVVTNTHGAKSAKNCPIDIFTGKRVIVIGDNDEPGVKGANSLAGEIVPYASEVKVIFPDGDTTETGGKDIRDVMNENQQDGIDYQTTVDDLIQKAEQEPAYQIQRNNEQDDDTSKNEVSEEYQPFPVGCLPPVMRDYVKAGGESLRCDLSFIAGPLLVVIASLIGASRVLKISDEWQVPAILWAIGIADSGSMKTPGQNLATKSLYKLQAKAHAKNRKTLDAYILIMEIYESRRKEYVKELAKAEGQPPDEPVRPDDPKIIDKVAGDVTFERLAQMVKNNPKGVPLVKDEMAGMIGNLNKYSGSKGADEAVLLEGYNLGTMQVARKHDPVDIFVPNAAISILGNTQPKIYKRLMDGSYRESGFMARFLKYYPRKTMKQFPGKGIPEHIKEALMKLVESLDLFEPMEMEEGEFQPVPVYMTNEAHQAYRSFHQQHNTEAVSMSGDLAAEWSKLEEIPARLALVFHCVECVASGGLGEKVSVETMNNAIELTEWFKNESLRVYRLFESADTEGSEQQREQQRLIEFIRNQGGTVSIRDTQRGMRFKTADDTEKALGKLVKSGVAKWVNIPRKKKGSPARGISLKELRQCDNVTGQPETSGSCCQVTLESEKNNPQPESEPEPTPEQPEATAPEGLSDFMNHLDDEIPL